jgi:hypothetical protein
VGDFPALREEAAYLETVVEEHQIATASFGKNLEESALGDVRQMLNERTNQSVDFAGIRNTE